jgi:hypothetical protein
MGYFCIRIEIVNESNLKNMVIINIYSEPCPTCSTSANHELSEELGKQVQNYRKRMAIINYYDDHSMYFYL